MRQALGVVRRNEWVNGRYKHLTVYAPGLAQVSQAGQFFHLLCGADVTSVLLRRPMSIYQMDPGRDELHFLYHVKGEGTRLLAEKQVGHTLDLVGPLGHGFTLAAPWRHVLVVARGVGMATLAPLIASARQRDVAVDVILSARTAADVLGEREFQAIGARVFTVTDATGSSQPEAVRMRVETLLGQGHTDAVYTCGSARLTRMLGEVANRWGLPGQVALEEHMACGIGMCQGCTRVFRREGSAVHLRVCREGPVFPLAEVMDA
ncbi:dihydroorotate dehydrogenase electron transfer subunit [Alicyclobacillaceae bacterium I2511]|nr:dihydroorotate dehydrogenase electron transfer subunit [Alicyclobacillaceae bacterium I2511]